MAGLKEKGISPRGFCLCPKCGFEKAHEAGIPCREESCPRCGTRLVREGSEFYLGG